jgi:hypothetical protein
VSAVAMDHVMVYIRMSDTHYRPTTFCCVREMMFRFQIVFNTAVAVFNTAVAVFNTAVAAFNTAVAVFNTAVAVFNTAVAVLGGGIEDACICRRL